jgi:hypothetical protein
MLFTIVVPMKSRNSAEHLIQLMDFLNRHRGAQKVVVACAPFFLY